MSFPHHTGTGMVPTSHTGPGMVSTSHTGPGMVSTSHTGPGMVPTSHTGPGMVPISHTGPGMVPTSHTGLGMAPTSHNRPGMVRPSSQFYPSPQHPTTQHRQGTPIRPHFAFPPKPPLSTPPSRPQSSFSHTGYSSHHPTPVHLPRPPLDSSPRLPPSSLPPPPYFSQPPLPPKFDPPSQSTHSSIRLPPPFCPIPDISIPPPLGQFKDFPNQQTINQISGTGHQMNNMVGNHDGNQLSGHQQYGTLSTETQSVFVNNQRGQEVQRVQENSDDKQLAEDSKWVSDWLFQKNRERPQLRTKMNIRVCDARQLLKSWVDILDKLRHIRDCASGGDGIFDPDTQSVVADKMSDLVKVTRQFHQSVDLPSLHKAVQSQRKRRERRKRQRKERYQDAVEKAEHREEKHQQIDENRQNVIKRDIEIKHAKDIKDEADRILSQVRKKMADVDRVEELLDSLRKLRRLRKDRAAQHSLYPPVESDKLFDSKLRTYGKLMKKQRVVYEDEECTLKVMLETELEETERKETYRATKREEAELKEWERKARWAMFGPRVNIKPSDHMYPFDQYYKQANEDLRSLVNIRRQWDMYLVPPGTPGGSKIPQSWVLPRVNGV